MRRLTVHLFAATALSFAACAALADPVLPCQDRRGCPDIIVSQSVLAFNMVLESRHVSPEECMFQEGETRAGNVRLLRFSFASPNIGEGALIVGAVADHPELFEFADCHGHFHFREYADYRLWTTEGYQQWLALREANPGALSADLLAANPQARHEMVAGNKEGFCIEDSFPCDYDFVPLDCPDRQRISRRTYQDCDLNQGISVGWADLYYLTLDGQWVDATNLGGRYVLEAEVNAEHLYEESDYSNNTSAVCVNIPPGGGQPAIDPDPTCVNPHLLDNPTACEICAAGCTGIPGCCIGPGCLCCAN